MISYTTANSLTDLEGIFKLQKQNLAQHLSPHEIAEQGFVTVDHSLDLLKKLNELEQHIIAKDADKVIGYLLAMTTESKKEIPVLLPMFEAFDNITYKGKKISVYNYLVVGQVCIDKAYRGQGILDQCYNTYKEYYSAKYDFAITEIAASNPRSLKAHERIGFKQIHRFHSPDGVEWVVVLWNWKQQV